MMNKEVYELTQHGAQALKDELEKLKTVDRVQIREAIKEAREQGDLSEYWSSYSRNWKYFKTCQDYGC